MPAATEDPEVRGGAEQRPLRAHGLQTPDGEAGLNYLCAGYKRFFLHCRPYTTQMAALRRAGQPPERLMQLLQAAELLSEWAQAAPIPGDRASQELSNMALVGWVMAEAALLRQESRGAHYRSDYPDTSPEWLHHLTIVGGD